MTARPDPLIHPITRLSICGLLAAGADWVEFAALRDAAGISDSVLSKQSRVLEDAGYVEVRKGAVGRRPRTWFRLTAEGRQAVEGHLWPGWPSWRRRSPPAPGMRGRRGPCLVIATSRARYCRLCWAAAERSAGIRDATAFAPHCPQPASPFGVASSATCANSAANYQDMIASTFGVPAAAAAAIAARYPLSACPRLSGRCVPRGPLAAATAAGGGHEAVLDELRQAGLPLLGYRAAVAGVHQCQPAGAVPDTAATRNGDRFRRRA